MRTVDDQLTMLEWMFVAEYPKDWNAANAMRRCADLGVYEGNWPGQDGYRMLMKPNVAAEIAKMKKAVIEAVELNVQSVVDDIKAVMTCDPRELSEIFHDACRCCWGVDHQYQYTPRQWKEAVAQHENTDAFKERGELLDPQGGVGFDPRKGPHPDCPECFGRGHTTVISKDTRTLSPTAVAMYSGAKFGKHGVEINTRSKDTARQDAAKWLGMNKEQTTLLVKGSAKDLDDDELAAIAGQGPKK